MRLWPEFESEGGVRDHMIRYLPRDHMLFAEMRQGAEYPEAHANRRSYCAEGSEEA